MPTEVIRYGVAAVLTAVLALASVSDVLNRKIPNWTVLATLGLFVVWVVADQGRTVLSALEAGAIAFAVTVALYAFKIVGAGDSKLFAAVALFGGMTYLPTLVVATTLVGGAIALVSLATRPRRALVMFTLRGKGDYGRGIPYGVAIAAGAAIVIWGMLTGLLPPIGSSTGPTLDDMTAFVRR